MKTSTNWLPLGYSESTWYNLELIENTATIITYDILTNTTFHPITPAMPVTPSTLIPDWTLLEPSFTEQSDITPAIDDLVPATPIKPLTPIKPSTAISPAQIPTTPSSPISTKTWLQSKWYVVVASVLGTFGLATICYGMKQCFTQKPHDPLMEPLLRGSSHNFSINNHSSHISHEQSLLAQHQTLLGQAQLMNAFEGSEECVFEQRVEDSENIIFSQDETRPEFHESTDSLFGRV